LQPDVRTQTSAKALGQEFDNHSVGVLSKLRSRLTYANAMSTIAVFVALGGGAYAVSVPRNSVGPKQLKRGAVTSEKVKNRSLLVSDFKPGQLALGSVARADDLDPPAKAPGATVASMSLQTRTAGRVFVLGVLRDPFLSCGDAPCTAQWGVYVDDKPVPDTGVTLEALAGEGDGRVYHTLYGVSPKLPAGKHQVRIARTDSGGIATVGQIGSQLGALQLSG
jgi:hypothetical protein